MENQNVQNTSPAQPTQTIIIEQKAPQKNGIGLAGFILSLIALFTEWIPVFGWIIWALGAIFSLVGLFKAPRGFAIAGFVISFISLIILIVFVGAIGAIVGSAALGN